MFNKQKVAVKSYTYVKNGLKIMLALIPGLPSETKLIDPILELVYNNMAWAGLFKNKITMEQRVALKQAVDGAFKTMYKTRPTIRINLPKEARNELEEYITNLAPKELVSRTVNKNVINILSKHSPEKDLEQITKTFVDSIEQQLVTNTPMSDLLNHTKMEILQEYLEAEIKALKGELKAVKEDVKAVKEKTEYLEKLVPNRESILNKAFSCSKERYEYLRDTWFAHIEFDERLFTGVNLLPIMLKPANSEEGATLYDTVKKHEGNFIFIGEGGIGKTTSLLQIWEKWLSEEKELPLYVPLNECNTTQEEHPITAYIKQWYLVDLNELNDKPVILLLDGFNELSERRDTVVREIKNLAAQTQTRRIVLTSRYNFIPTYNLKGFATYDIQPLRSEVIKAFWEETQLKIPELQNIALPEGWETLLSTPMMLTLFANTCTVQKELEEKQLFPFKPSKTKGELIYNYLLRQLAKLYIDNQQTDLPTAYVALFWFAPYVAWQMERTNQFSIDTDKCEQQLSEYLLRKQSFIQKSAKHFLEKACETIPYWNNYNSASKLLHILEKQVYLLRKENGSYTFQHQHFRDFLSALHIDNALEKAFTELAVSGTFSVPEEVTGRVFPSHISDMLGGYYGDYQNQEKRIVETNLHKLLDQLRCLNCTQVGFAVNNIIGVWRMAREDRIVGENLTKLDLSKVLMNGIFFSKHSLATQFDGSKISDATFLPQGHTRYVKSAMYSPDGSHILTASGDKTAKEWDRVTGECLRTFQGHHHTIESAVYSPDGSHILTASRDTTVKEWSRETGECLCTFQGHHHAVLSAAYSPDGSYVLTGSVDRTVREWDRTTGKCIHIYQGHIASVCSAVYSPDGLRILTSSYDGTVREWDRTTGKWLYIYKSRAISGHFVVYSPDGSRILTPSIDNVVREWDRETRTCIQTFQGHTWDVVSAVYSSDGSRILTASRDGTAKEWSRETGECLCTFQGHTSEVLSAVYSSNEYCILTASSDDAVKEWDRVTGECLRTFQGHDHAVYSAVYNPDGSHILTALGDKTVKEWDRVTGECLRIFQGHTRYVKSAAYSPDGSRILTASGDKTAKEWDRVTGECLRTFQGHTKSVMSAVYNLYNVIVQSVYSAVYNPDGSHILAVSGDYTIGEWDRTTGKCIHIYSESIHCNKEYNGSVYSVVYSPDGSHILATFEQTAVMEWDRTTGKCIQTYIENLDNVSKAVYSPDGSHILTTSYVTTTSEWGTKSTVREWDRTTGKCIQTYPNRSGRVLSAVYSPDGSHILTASSDGTAKEWNRTTGQYEWDMPPYSGVFIAGCSFEKCKFSNEELKQLIRKYGGKI